jgi:hypothetical protein
MTILRAALTGLLAVVLFASIAALAVASPPGNPTGSCGKGPAADQGPPGTQYGHPGGSPVGPPPGSSGPPGNQYAPGNGPGSPGGPDGCPTHGQYGQYGP